MKKAITLLLMFTMVLGLSAQTKRKYYAIDGSVWQSTVDRDRKEDLIWKKLEIDLLEVAKIGKLTPGQEVRDVESFKEIFHNYRIKFATVREANIGKEILTNKEVRTMLAKYDILISPGYAKNKELFNLVEYSDAFNLLINEHNYYLTLLSLMLEEETYKPVPERVIKDLNDRMEMINEQVDDKLADIKIKEQFMLEAAQAYVKKNQPTIGMKWTKDTEGTKVRKSTRPGRTR